MPPSVLQTELSIISMENKKIVSILKNVYCLESHNTYYRGGGVTDSICPDSRVVLERLPRSHFLAGGAGAQNIIEGGNQVANCGNI